MRLLFARGQALHLAASLKAGCFRDRADRFLGEPQRQQIVERAFLTAEAEVFAAAHARRSRSPQGACSTPYEKTHCTEAVGQWEAEAVMSRIRHAFAVDSVFNISRCNRT